MRLTVLRQVASVLEQCQTPNTDSPGRELLISVPELHHLLAAELSAIQVRPANVLVCPVNALNLAYVFTVQGAAAASQRALIQGEIESILQYAVQWNAVQESAAARRELLDSWRQVTPTALRRSFKGSSQVTETLITVSPADLLPPASKQVVVLQLLQLLLARMTGETAEQEQVAGLDTLLSSTVLLLTTALRQTYSATAPDPAAVMGDTFVGLLDTQPGGQAEQLYPAALQVKQGNWEILGAAQSASGRVLSG